MTNAAGQYKSVAYKVESTFGTAPSAGSAQLLRRVQSTLDLSKDTYESNEIRTDFQTADYRHGVRRVKGGINGELSAGTYKDFMAAALKRAFAAVTAITGATVTIAGSGPYTVTRSAGSFLTDGVKVGDVIRLSVGTLNALNINKNLMVTALTATVATVITLNGSAMAAEGPITTTTITVVGKKTFTPQTGHTDLSYSIEHFHSDITQSELFTGCKVAKISLGLPPTGMATIGFEFMGKDMTPAQAQYYTSPSAVTTTGNLSAVNGVVRLNDATVAILTGLSLTIDSPFTGDPVVGSNTVPTLFPGKVGVSGQATVYFADETLRDVFVDETEVSLYLAFTADNTAASDFVAFSLPRIKLGGASKNDGQGGLVQTMPFKALFNSSGGTGIATEATTLSVQDSAA